MHITFPKSIARPSEEEFEFLKTIQEKFPHGEYIMARSELNASEFSKLISLLGPERGLVINPVAWAYGCAYDFAHVTPAPNLKGAKAKWNLLFGMSERHLLPGLDNSGKFEFLAPYIMRPENIAMVVSCGLPEPVNDYGRYDY